MTKKEHLISKYPAEESLGISNSFPDIFGTKVQKNFDRYAFYETPNGGHIHIIAQNEITNDQIIRVRNVLSHYLTDNPQSKNSYSNDKSKIANKMAENGATISLMNGSDNGKNKVEPIGQPLYYTEVQVEGGQWYLDQNYNHRDATYEEIFHLVHDTGIGVDSPKGKPSPYGVSPEFQKKIRKAQKYGLSNKLWAYTEEVEGWLKELSQENSLSQEYIVAALDSWYGLWSAFPEPGGMWGFYIAKDRAEVKEKDPMGAAILEDFLLPYLSYNARIPSTFKGDFSLKYNPNLLYTNHSRYLKDITLTGSHNSSVTVNELDNNITGNNGINRVIFSGTLSEYIITKSGEGKVTIRDTILLRDGTNNLNGIEELEFKDQTVETSSL